MADALIVRRSEGAAPEGAGCVFKAMGEQTGNRFDFMVAAVEYLSGPPLHLHHEQDDSFYVLSGVLTCQVNDDVFELHPGDFVLVPPGVPHTFDNVDPDQGPVEAINLMTPGGFDDFIIELAGAGEGALSPETARDLTEKHGVEWVGPPLREKLELG